MFGNLYLVRFGSPYSGRATNVVECRNMREMADSINELLAENCRIFGVEQADNEYKSYARYERRSARRYGRY